jgi:hypothetical protein
MDKVKHDHGVVRVAKICEELSAKANDFKGRVCELQYNVLENVKKYIEIANFLDKANHSSR